MDITHDRLDSFKLAAAKAVLDRVDMASLRQHGISNLQRWRDSGVWCSAYGEWLNLLSDGSDAEIREAMIGESENSNRLRQSPPYTGLLSEPERIRLWREHVGQRLLD
ncbi:hypothetical protein [Massilia soli]|uniref:Uncharacterized protein n=1 Tax=Massilia soli TaxID=2792854 RepID=A0ABS7SVY5_9BURK|nr:hypothetical protein [Massilia soli]MBZ2210075.1 hypothetical protein [Massilia soli]